MLNKPISSGPAAQSAWRDLGSVPPRRYFTSHPVVDRFRLAVPFDYVAISGLDLEGYHFGRIFSIDTDLPTDYVEAYDQQKLYEIDLFVKAASSGRVVIEADVFAKAPRPDSLDQLCSTFGIENRTLVPVARNALVYGAVTFTRKLAFTSDEIAFLTLIAEPMHTAVTRPLMERFAVSHLRLSRGEVACLMEASHGLTSEEIAKATGYQNDTVNSYIKSAIRKLGAANRTQAIADAIRRNLIP